MTFQSFHGKILFILTVFCHEYSCPHHSVTRSRMGHFSPLQEIYSIDESFLDLTGIPGTGREIGSEIRRRVRQWVGIPTCVGIGLTKTLAKLANHLAKKMARLQGVCDLSGLATADLMRAIRHVPIGEVWGVGRKLAPKLQGLHKIYHQGFKYSKAGICRLDLASQQKVGAQGSLFSSLVPDAPDKSALMSVLDDLNQAVRT